MGVTDLDKMLEIFGFLLAQEIAKSPLTPVDTRRMAQSFPGTVQVDVVNGKIIFKTPFYTEYVNEGTRKLKARPFIQAILHQRGEELLKKSFQLASQ